MPEETGMDAGRMSPDPEDDTDATLFAWVERTRNDSIQHSLQMADGRW